MATPAPAVPTLLPRPASRPLAPPRRPLLELAPARRDVARDTGAAAVTQLPHGGGDALGPSWFDLPRRVRYLAAP